MRTSTSTADFARLCRTSTLTLVAAMAAGGCYEGPIGDTGVAWDPELGGSTGSEGGEDDEIPDPSDEGADDEPEQPDPTDGGSDGCEPLASRFCTCDDGAEGEQWCFPDGSAFGNCQCEPSDTPDQPDPDDSEPPAEPPPTPAGQICFLGADRAGTTCLPVHQPGQTPAGYEYPGTYQNNPNYRPPVAYIDLDAVDVDTQLSPNFKLGEIAQRTKGQFALVQPHAVASLQALRDAVGAINVNSGYRSPAYNTQIGGANYSRHMYGDGFDLDPVSVSLSVLETACTDQGGMLVEYDSHVHCDFRFDDVDPILFGAAAAAPMASEPLWAAEIEEDAGVYFAPAFGFDEGEPKRHWRALDADGELIAEGFGPIFVPPPGTGRVEVEVGRQVWLATDLDARVTGEAQP